MNKEDVIRLALEHFGAVLKPSDLELKLALLAVAQEREACAKLCDEKYEAVPKNDPYAEADGDYSELIYAGAAQDCAEAIRARGET
jgi:hypothetical protein